MRRLLVVYQHLPHYRQDVFRALERAPGWSVEFAAGCSSRDSGIARMDPSALERVHRLRNFWIGPFLWQWGLTDLLRRDWDHVIFLGDAAYLSTWVGASLCRLRRTQVAFWTIGWHRPERGFRKYARLMFYHLANQLLLYGEHGRAIGVGAGYPAARMTVIHNSSSEPPQVLDESAHDLERLEEAISATPSPAVGGVVRLTAPKQLGELLEAAAILREKGQCVSVLLGGDGPEALTLRYRAEQLGVPLTLLGPIYGDSALKAFYQRCLVTVIPSKAGLTTLQSLKYGRPVVTHNDPNEQVPEFEAIRPGISGGLFRKGDVQDLAEQMGYWISRVLGDPNGVAASCHAVVQGEWSAGASAQGILAGLLRSEAQVRTRHGAYGRRAEWRNTGTRR